MAIWDWRGQGMSDRLVGDLRRGHVGDFSERQRDLNGVLAYEAVAVLPGTRVMLAHPMDCAVRLRRRSTHSSPNMRQIVDFRRMLAAEHAALIECIYRFLISDAGVIRSDWMAAQVARLDRMGGGINALSKRLAFIRMWTYVANRARRFDDPDHWRERWRAPSKAGFQTRFTSV